MGLSIDDAVAQTDQEQVDSDPAREQVALAVVERQVH